MQSGRHAQGPPSPPPGTGVQGSGSTSQPSLPPVWSLWCWPQVYTGGAYTPTTHRVINTDPAMSRVSIPFFYETAFDSVIKPIEQVASVRGADYQPVTYGQHLLKKVLSNFELEDDGRKQPIAV